ncbi:hypothetical protein CROQUDRAFT_46841 [Cronartium quercuum f. sp. fusiforme G11]|uniref:Glutamate--cysteine ligase n=1 Tax=Cronartium quercuum f. sp. fusiforme G11 TaxID=708437 RepID=A0A9P6NJN5_9BASI|nr:hypothetical protein CROQUDRAFT_46841 [Cronartium quercuum f. sp. fusiforme G11]
MGLLSLGTAFDWPEASQHSNRVRQLGIQQLIKLYHSNRSRTFDELLWGDEIEYLLITIDHDLKQVKLSLTQLQTLELLRSTLLTLPLPSSVDVLPTFHQEYGRFMLESTPGKPYGPKLKDLIKVEIDMRYRRKLAQSSLKSNQLPITLTSFPRLGVTESFTIPSYSTCGPVAESLYLPDQIINEHVRFPTLTANIRQRRGKKVEIYVPIYQDVQTPKPFNDPTVPKKPPIVRGTNKLIEIPDVPEESIYLDAMGFGMGCCCLQLTFQTPCLDDARRLYDTLVPLAPIMMALSAGSPIFKGFLSARDTRWSVISGAVDDRTITERQSEGREAIPKSRYASVSVYIANQLSHDSSFDDVPAPVDAGLEAELLSVGFDRLLAKHFAHLFIRDPLVIFSESLVDADSRPDSTDHFENIQSTNWQSVRFKPPPSPNSDIGWRVEFRTMEVQLTDFENAAYAIFMRLIVLLIISEPNTNFYLPLSKVDENMRRAEEMDAARKQKFWFKTEGGIIDEFTMKEIICGSDRFDGLLTLVRDYVNKTGTKLPELDKYFDLIHARASGQLLTTASYLRKFVDRHSAYAHDSVINEELAYAIVQHANALERGDVRADELLGDGYVPVDI